jgi:cell division protein FtsB
MAVLANNQNPARHFLIFKLNNSPLGADISQQQHNDQGKPMKNKHIFIAAITISLSTMFFPIQSLEAETSSESERLQKLERAVEQLEQRNAELEKEVSSLKKQTASAAAVPAEGPTRTQTTYDGKTYVEKSVPAEKTSTDKWKLSTPITELELFGDVRLRYEYRGGQTDDDSPLAKPANGVAGHDDWQERERERYRLRLGLRGTLADDWFFGVRLETSQNPRSTNVTFGDDTSTSSAGGGGPFAKGSDGINVGQAYLGYRGFHDITLTGGKMPNPLVSTWMVWDPDINPEGLAEQWKHSFSIGSGGAAPQSYSKDTKTVATAPPAASFLKIDVFATFGQFIYDDANPENPLGPRSTTTQPRSNGHQFIPNTDAFLLAWQVGAKFTFPKTLYAQVAPTVYNYTGNGDTFNIHFQGGDPNLTNSASMAQNQTGINSLLVFDMPMEVGWKLGQLPMRFFADFAVNLDGDDRALAAGHPDKGDQRYAYQVGVGVGQLKAKHDWQVDVYWQHSEQYSLDPNLIDNDIFDARLNMEGVGARAGYALSNAVSFNLSYLYGWRIDNSLGTGGANDIAINPLDQYQLLQADLNIKF